MFPLGEVTEELCTDLKFQIHENKHIFCPHDFFDIEEKCSDFLCELLLFYLVQCLFIGEKKIYKKNKNVEFLSSYK